MLATFQSVFTAPTWAKVQELVIATLLARSRRTVTAALRQIDLSEEAYFGAYHYVLNRTHWSALALSRQLLRLVPLWYWVAR